jgi:hypothetical protein
MNKKQELCDHSVIYRVYNADHEETNEQECSKCGKRWKDNETSRLRA